MSWGEVMFAYLRERVAHSGGALFGVVIALVFFSVLMLAAFDALAPFVRDALGYDMSNPFGEALRHLGRIFNA